MIKASLVCGVSFLILVRGFGQSQVGKVEAATAEEYAVYSALLNQITRGRYLRHARLLVVSDTTVVPECAKVETQPWREDALEKTLSTGELKQLIADLTEKNDKQYPLTRQFNLSRPYRLLSPRSFYALFKRRRGHDDWDAFYRKYPNSSGYVTFSRLGFNDDSTKALVYRSVICGSRCGYGDLVLLKKEDGFWKPITKFFCWAI